MTTLDCSSWPPRETFITAQTVNSVSPQIETPLPRANPRPVVAEANTSNDQDWMKVALEEADVAAASGEVPVGCVLVDFQGREIARGHNGRETRSDPTAHAEILALRRAAARLRDWRLERVTAYVTLEPCVMCAGAFVLARIARLVYACADPKGGAVDTSFQIGRDERLNHRFEVTSGVLAEQSTARLRTFFDELRRRSG